MGVHWIPFTLGAMVVAAVMAVDPGGASPFGPARWWLVSTLALVGGGLACWGATRRLDRRSTLLWGALLVLLGVSALANDDTRVALLGHPVRHLGLITWGLFALSFAAGQQLVRHDHRRTVLRAAVVAALGSGLWCLWELVAGAPIAIVTTSERLTGPFGSAAILGAACCLLIPVCAGIALDVTDTQRWRIAGAVGAVTNMVALVGSGTRAAWVALAVALVVLALRRPPSRQLMLGAVVVVVVAFAIVSPRLTDVIDRTNGASSRLDEWEVATRVIGEHPLIGVGPEGYRIAAVGAVDADYERTYGRDQVLPDRAHSGPLDVAATGGVLAGLVHSVLVGGIALLAVRTIGRGGRSGAFEAHSAATIGMCVGIVAYALQQLLLFPLAELDPVWWLLAGMLVATTTPTTATDRPDADPTRSRSAALVALTLAPLTLVAGVLDVAADRQADRALSTADIDEAVQAADRAVDLRPDDLRRRSVAIAVHLERGTLADVDAALSHAEAALDWSPHDPIALDERASALLTRATVTGDDTDVGSALDEWQRLAGLDPVRARWQTQLARAAALADDIELALAAASTAAELRPDDPEIAALLAAIEARVR